MKKLFLNSTILAVIVSLSSLLLFTSCDKENPEDLLGSISVQLKLKEGLKDIALNNINITLFNTQDNVEIKSFSDQDGKVVFGALPAGSYNITVSESREGGEYTLTGTLNDIVVAMKNETVVELVLDALVSNAGLVIKELYFVGANDGYASLFKDQFIEIFNNSSEVIYADGLYVGHLLPDKNLPKPFSEMPGLDLENKIYFEWVYQIPGNGTQYPIQPSQGFMIALNAINFKEGRPNPEKSVDNSIADMETYAAAWLESQGKTPHIWDMDNPNVPNATPIFLLDPMNFFLLDLSDPAVVIFRKEAKFTEADLYNFKYTNNYGSPADLNLLTIPTSIVIDGVEVLANSTRNKWKRLPAFIDASFAYILADGGAYYSGQSLRRKIDKNASAKFGRTILQDLNNSQIDFEMITYPDAKGYNKK